MHIKIAKNILVNSDDIVDVIVEYYDPDDPYVLPPYAHDNPEHFVVSICLRDKAAPIENVYPSKKKAYEFFDDICRRLVDLNVYVNKDIKWV